MLVTLSAVDTSSANIYKRQITFAQDGISLKQFLLSKNIITENIIEVKVGNKLNDMTAIEIDCVADVTMGDFSRYKPCFMHAILSSNSEDTSKAPEESSDEIPPPKKMRTLMDFARMRASWPSVKHNEYVASLKQYLKIYKDNKVEANEYIEFFLANVKINAKVLLYDTMLIIYKTKISGVSSQDVLAFSELCQSVTDLYWYLSPNAEKLKSHGATLPIFLQSCQIFNNPVRSKHKVKNMRQETILDLTAKINSILEKSFTHSKSFNFLRDLFEKLGESAVKYADYLEENKEYVSNYQECDTLERKQEVIEIPHTDKEIKCIYSPRELKIIQLLIEDIEIAEFFEPVSITLEGIHKGLRYTLIKHIKELGPPLFNIVLYSCHYGPATGGNIYHVWKEDPNTDELTTARQKVITEVTSSLPKFFSRKHKKRAREVMELVMQDKITPVQYRAIYYELTGDKSTTDNSYSKEVDDRMKLVIQVADANVIRDLRVNNHRKSSFDLFWELTERKIEEMTAVNDRCHSETTQDGNVVVNLALAVSVRDLYEKCKRHAQSKGVTDENTPSLSWFRFQFWPKNTYTAAAMHYTGKFNVRFMVQQRNVRKFSVDAHYCNALCKYSRELAVKFSEYCAFLRTDDKCKIKVGEPNFPVAAVTRGRQVLVAKNQLFQVADHDMSSTTLIPTVVLAHNIPDDLEKSWYRGVPYAFLKITATDPSSALRNAAEIENVLINRYHGKENIPPIVFLYTDGGPEHRTNFVSVKIAMIALQKSLNLDMLLALQTAPGHSYRNPVEKINCILNIGLYGIGVMRQTITEDPFLEKKIHSTGNTEDVIFSKNLFKKSLEPCMLLINESFASLQLKGNDLITQERIEESATAANLMKNIKLDANLTGKETVPDLKNCTELSAYLNHCTKQRNYFCSVKKCCKEDCTTCLPIRLPVDVFEQLHHLPDPMPDPLNEGHYLKFHGIYGTETNESHMPSLVTTARKCHGIPFNPVLQHVKNTGLTICDICES